MTSSTILEKQSPSREATSGNSKTRIGIKDEFLNFTASGDLLRILYDLQAKYRVSISESIRRGVALYAIALKESRKGSKLVFVRNGEIVGQVDDI